MEKPFIFMTIPIVIGILIAYYLKINILVLSTLILAALVYYIFNINKKNRRRLTIPIIFLLLGMILVSLNMSKSQLINKVGEELTLIGVVKDIKYKNEEEGKYIVLVEELEEKPHRIRINEKIVLKIIGDKNLDIGYRIFFTGTLKEPMTNTNPKLFNYKKSLLSDNIYTTATIKDYSIAKIEKFDLKIRDKIKIAFRNKVEDVFDNNLSKDNSSLMKGIVLGEYSYLDEDNIAMFRNLGLAHALAVSGLHVGIIASFLMLLLSRIGISRKFNFIIIFMTIWLYSFLIGFPPSVLRANIMFTLLFYSQLAAEPYDPINALLIAMFILLVINPFWIFNVGFQLSFLATFSILYITPKLNKVFYPYNNKLIYSISTILGVQIGLFPIQSYYFNKVSFIGILANLIIAPLLSLSLILGILMLVLNHILTPLTKSIGRFLNLFLSIQFTIINLLDKIPFGILKIYSPSIVEIMIYYILVLIILKVININRFNKKFNKVILYYLVAVLLINTLVMVLDNSIEVHFIDVGQGDCIFIKTSRGNFLMDTGGNVIGSFDVGKNIVLPYLQKIGINELQGVFITHFDEDHCKSLPYLIDNMNISCVLTGYEDYKSPVYKSIKQRDVPLILLKEGDIIWLDKNTKLEIISPSKDLLKTTDKANDLSLVSMLVYNNRKMLFTGDIEKDGENSILNKIDCTVDFIKVPHHGSITSSTIELLNKIKPRIGFISVGRNNFYGHPSEEVINRYESIGTLIYRTDESGLIKLYLDKDKFYIKTFIKENVDLTYILEEYGLNLIFYLVYYLVTYLFIKYYWHKEKELVLLEL